MSITFQKRRPHKQLTKLLNPSQISTTQVIASRLAKVRAYLDATEGEFSANLIKSSRLKEPANGILAGPKRR